MEIGKPFIGDPTTVLTLILFFGCLLVIVSVMARRTMQPDLISRAGHFVPNRREDDRDASPSRLTELQELRSQFLFLRAVEIYGLGYFVALPGLFAALMFSGLKITVLGIQVTTFGMLGNLAITVSAVSTILICYAYLSHRLATNRMLGFADRLCYIRHRKYE